MMYQVEMLLNAAKAIGRKESNISPLLLSFSLFYDIGMGSLTTFSLAVLCFLTTRRALFFLSPTLSHHGPYLCRQSPRSIHSIGIKFCRLWLVVLLRAVHQKYKPILHLLLTAAARLIDIPAQFHEILSCGAT